MICSGLGSVLKSLLGFSRWPGRIQCPCRTYVKSGVVIPGGVGVGKDVKNREEGKRCDNESLHDTSCEQSMKEKISHV